MAMVQMFKAKHCLLLAHVLNAAVLCNTKADVRFAETADLQSASDKGIF
jgi:hypothetical protein